MHHTDHGKRVISLKGSEPLLRKLMAVGSLSDDDIETLDRLDVERAPRECDVFSEGDSIRDLIFLREGWACRYRLLDDGRRHIVNFLLPGDIIGPFTPTAHQFVAGITDLTLCRLSRDLISTQALRYSGISAAIEALMVAEYELIAERTVSLGRRNAKERTAHLLMELHERLARIGRVADNSFELPLTQENIGDALGLSIVHVNRTVRALREDRIATVGYGRVTIHDFERLAELAHAEVGSGVVLEEATGLSPKEDRAASAG